MYFISKKNTECRGLQSARNTGEKGNDSKRRRGQVKRFRAGDCGGVMHAGRSLEEEDAEFTLLVRK